MTTRASLRVEEAVMKFKGQPALWIKDKTGKTADPWQVVAMEVIKEHPKVLQVWPPRFGKTWDMEAVCLEEVATNPYEREMIFGPVQKQANNALKEQLEFIEISEILSAWIATRRGKRQISETKYEFINRSGAETFGIRSNFDSENATILRGEEWDDMDLEIWTNRVIQRGGRKNVSGLPLRIRLSGTIQWGKGPVFEYDHDPGYVTVPKFDIYDGLEFDIYDKVAIEEIRDKLTDDQWLRIYLLKYTDAKNFIWETHLRECLMKALEIGWQGVEYRSIPYRPKGTVYLGLDMGHSGEGKQHSVYRMDLIEVIGDVGLWLNGKEWESTTDPDLIMKEAADWWEYYQVSAGYGDALKANDIAMLNDMLFERGLIDIDRSEYPENKPANWDKWAFSPKWNTGKFKYLTGGITRVKIENQKFIIPYFDRKDDRHIAKMAFRLRQALLNIREVVGNGSYPILEAIKKEIGDDPFDAINMAWGCANDKMLLEPDLSMLGVQGGQIVTSAMAASVMSDLDRGNERYSDFIH